MIDKVILSNRAALQAKYGSAGVAAVARAVRRLVAADRARDLNTLYICLDDPRAMKKYGGTAVKNPSSAQQNKRAVDAIYRALAPDYILLLGSFDVIPHQKLANPAFNPKRPDDDTDRHVPSDLPYACEAAYSTAAENFTGPTRVVGRLPDITGVTSPHYLIRVIHTAAAASPRARSAYEDCFNISTFAWKKSTALSLQAIFGADDDGNICPPSEPPWKARLLARRTHFINCHGASRSPQFFGQKRDDYPVAYDAAALKGRLSEGTVGAMECCYGAHLYDPSKVKGRQPGMANTYLANKAYGYLGSTTIAYGPTDSNDWADLLCQFFLESILEGASLGRALLEARQKYVQVAATPLGPVDLKTMAQFLLLGDPSVQPVVMDNPAAAQRASRVARRKDLITNGLSLARIWPRVNSKPIVHSSAPHPGLRRIARELGLQDPSFLTFHAPKAAPARDLPKALLAKQAHVTTVHLMMDRQKVSEDGIARTFAVVVREARGKVISVHQGYAKR